MSQSTSSSTPKIDEQMYADLICEETWQIKNKEPSSILQLITYILSNTEVVQCKGVAIF